jgi:hypothetical protein
MEYVNTSAKLFLENILWYSHDALMNEHCMLTKLHWVPHQNKDSTN